MMHRVRIGLFLPAAALFAACSSGGGSAPVARAIPATTGAPSTKVVKTAAVTFSLAIPLAGRAASHGTRAPRYLSPNTNQFQVTITSNNGTPISNPQTTSIAATNGSPNCTTSTTTLTCTGTIDAPIGSDAFSVEALAYNSSQLLSAGTVTATISPTAANLVPIVLDGVPATVTITFPTTQPTPGTAMTILVTVTAKDCTGATIVSPGNYLNPITLANGDQSGSTVLSETTVNAPSDVVTLAWDGSANLEYAGITPTLTNTSNNCAQNGTTGYFLPAPEPPYVWLGAASGAGNIGPYTWLVGYPERWIKESGITTRPGRTIEVPGDQFTAGVAADAAGNVYSGHLLSNGNGGIHKFAAGAMFNAMPAATIDITNYASLLNFTVNAAGDVYAIVSNDLETHGVGNVIVDYLASENYATQHMFYTDGNPNYYIVNAGGDAMNFDAFGNLLVAETATNANNGGTISEFDPTGTVIGHFVLANGGSNNQQNAFGVAGDASGTIYVEAAGASYPNEILTYAASGAATGVQTGSFTSSAPLDSGGTESGLGLDALGNIYTFQGNTGNVFAPSAVTANTSPATPHSASPIWTYTYGFDPTTPSGSMSVPSGIIPPIANGVANAMFVQR